MRRLAAALVVALEIGMTACAPSAATAPTGAPTAVSVESAAMTPKPDGSATPAINTTPNSTASTVAPPSPTIRMATNTTTLPPNVQSMQQQMRDVQQDLQAARQQLSQVTPSERSRVEEQLSTMLSQMGELIGDMQPAMGRLPPDTRQRAAGTARQMQTTIDRMARQLGTAPAAATPAPEQMPDMGRLGHQMDRVHQQMRGMLGHTSTSQLQGVLDDASTMAGQIDQLMGQLGTAIAGMSPADLQQLVQTARQLQAIGRGMRETAITPTPVSGSGPTPTAGP